MTRRRQSSLDHQLDSLHHQLQSVERRATQFEKMLTDLQKMKEETFAEKTQLELKKQDLEAQRQPINWLPPELVAQIFLAVVASDINDPTYRPAVVLSHVCVKWRNIALMTPTLWSRILLRGFVNTEVAEVFLLRSGVAPLDVEYQSHPDSSLAEETAQVQEFAAKFQKDFERIEYFSVECKTPAPLFPVVSAIRSFPPAFPILRQLSTSILNPQPSFEGAVSLLFPPPIPPRDKRFDASPPFTTRLHHLKVEQLPLLNFPLVLLTNLRVLELTYSPRLPGAGHHHLKMSGLCRVLDATPFLEELILLNTVPYFDTTLPCDDGTPVPGLVRRPKVDLPNLKFIDWSHPFPQDVFRFLSMLDTPALEKLDLWVEGIPNKRIDSVFLRGYLLSSSPNNYITGTITYPSLRDLSFQGFGEEAVTSSLRKLIFPRLESATFANIDGSSQHQSENCISWPAFPRLEYIFRDPRLPNLTHLTLSYFKIPAEDEKVEAMLRYMPVLSSLSLDSCCGVKKLLEVLSETVVGNFPSLPYLDGRVPGLGNKSNTQVIRGVKVCPRLEALSFWGCEDLHLEGLRIAVLARNRTRVPPGSGMLMGDDLQAVPNGATQPINTRDEKGSSHKTEDIQIGRQIKPLRKLRRVGQSSYPEDGAASTADGLMNGSVMSTVIAMRECFEPAHVIYLRIANCKNILQEEATSLRDLGVADVIWVGSG